MIRRSLRLAAGVGLVTLLFGAALESAQPVRSLAAPAAVAPPLGSAQSFSVLAGSTVTNTGTGTITGDLGVSPGSAVTGFPPGVVVSGSIHTADATAAAAQSSVTTAYNNLASQACSQNLTGQDLGGKTLAPGVYCFNSSAQLTGILLLDAQGDPSAVWVFQIGSTLTTASGASVVVINGGSVCNAFWQVGSSATLGTGTAFGGNILALASITVTTGTTLKGRALARTGAVTLDTNTVSGCAVGGPVVCSTITLAPSTMPNGTRGVAYSSQTVTASGGTAPYTFSVSTGALPTGLTLSSAGVVSGTPTAVGTFTFTVKVTDVNACPGTIVYTIVIAAPACPVIALAPPTLPNGTINTAYSQAITASGGTAPYSFGVTAGALPGGLTLTAAGVLAGTPTAATTSAVTIQATDANSCVASVPYTVRIAPAPASCPTITIAPSTLASGTRGFAYSQTITASGGASPYSFGVTAGTLPAGLTLTSAGGLSGTPTTAGTSTITIQATDANSCFASVPFTIVIAACGVITLAPPTLPNGIVNTAYSQAITGSGGTAPYTFGVTAGAVPAGMTLTSAGVLAGTPTTATTSAVTIQATDANSCVASVPYTVKIAPASCPVITLAPPTLSNGTLGFAYSQTITGSGGTAPYSFGVTAGALPLGVTLTSAGVLSGTPTTAASSTATIQGTDANSCFASVAYTVVIAACGVITLAPTTLPNATLGLAYSQTITGSGGIAPYSFGVTAGTLPASLSLTSAGVLAGTVTTPGTAAFTIRGTDANACFADVPVTLQVVSGVPTMPQALVILLALGLTAVGYVRLRWRARSD